MSAAVTREGFGHSLRRIFARDGQCVKGGWPFVTFDPTATATNRAQALVMLETAEIDAGREP